MDGQLDVRQANFASMSHHFNGLATEIQLCENLPAIQEGDRIARALENINRNIVNINTRLDGIDARLDRIDARLDRMDARFDRLENSINAEKLNSVARLINSTATRSNANLQPLYGLDNIEVEDFPPTPHDLSRLPMAEVTRILQRLGLDSPGSLAQKRTRLFVHTGVVSESRTVS